VGGGGAALSHDARAAGRALALTSLGVFLASATWFTGTAAVPALRRAWGLSEAQSAWLTISVQAGFITGTFLYAVLNVSDVFNPRRVFFASAAAGALCNAGFAALSGGLPGAVALRFLTGVTLAGVYPVAMKIVASWFTAGLGWRLGIMVGALALGTSTPYLVRAVGAGADWRLLTGGASLAALLGGVLVLGAVGDGPRLPARAPFDPRALVRVFGPASFRLNAFGYFGHMWELYAFWSLLPFFLAGRLPPSPPGSDRVALVAFLTVALGGLGCAAGGWVSRRVGERRVALFCLAASAACCLLSALAFAWPAPALVAFVLLWGVVVVADSPQFSALAARYCPPAYTGTAFTVQNGVGFAVTLVSIQLLPLLAARVGWRWTFLALAPGPILGAWAMARLGALPEAVGQ
jgi:MFS family permease